MGFLDQLESFAGSEMHEGGSAIPAEQQSSVSRAFISTLSQHPGGVGGLLEQFRQNGMQQHADSWVNSQPGQPTTALSPQQVQQGTGSTLLGEVAQRSGLPQGVVTMALTTILPLVMQHMTPNGQVPGQQQQGGIAQELLSKIL